MKATITALLLFGVPLCADDKIAIDLSHVNRLPSVRAQAIAANALTDVDSTPEIGRKREAYFLALRAMAEDLRSRYYQHDEFPADVFVGIDERVRVLIASQYPMSPTTGASYVGFLRDSFRIQLAEETICTMVEAILSRAGDVDVRIESEGTESFADWQRRWKKVGENKDGPNQALQTTPTTRSEI